jgi:hypothetical protein
MKLDKNFNKKWLTINSEDIIHNTFFIVKKILKRQQQNWTTNGKGSVLKTYILVICKCGFSW